MNAKLNQVQEYLQKGQLAAASDVLSGYLMEQPLDDRAWLMAAQALYRQHRFADAVEHYRAALRLRPDNADIYADLGAALRADQRPGEAEAMLREAIRRNPKNALPVFTLANLCSSQRRYPEAEHIYRGLLAANPDSLPAIENLCAMLVEINRPEDAISILQGFLTRHTDHSQALSMLAIAQDRAGHLDVALTTTLRTIALDPPKTLDMRLASYMSLVGRTGRLDLRPHVLELVRTATPATLPDHAPEQWLHADRNALRRFTYLFPYYGINDRDLLKVHRALGKQIAANFPPTIQAGPPRPGKLRVGFLSYNFGNHPIGHLLSVFFEAHRETNTELFLYSLHQQASAVDVNGYGPRIHRTADHFRDCRNMSARDLAHLLRSDDLHILIDLDGYLHGGRPEVLSTRPARVQIHWLQSLAGCPAPYFDYTIVDRIIVPDNERDQGNGPLIRLADVFQCGERFELPPFPSSRTEQGLLEKAFVFCAFGNWLKIDPEVFEVWMNLLHALPDSVLWLSNGPTPESIEGIRKAMEAKGIDPARLVLANRTDDKIAHIDRHRLADLFLDTFTFSAATTTMDALSAGLPVLTKRGKTAQGRLSEAHIRAVGPTDLIVDTVEDYYTTALRLARNPEELAKHRKALLEALPGSRLFDAKRMARQFGLIYAEVWQRYQAGEQPTHFDVIL